MRLRTSTRTRRPIRPEPAAPQRAVIAPDRGPDAPRRRFGRRSAIIVALVLACIAGIAATLVLTMPRLEPAGAERLTNAASPTFVLDVEHPVGIRAAKVRATVDGEAVPAERVDVLDGGARIEVRAPRLEDGAHDVRVTVADTGYLRTDLSAAWRVTVDTVAPPARIVEPRAPRGARSAYLAAGVVPVTKLPLQLEVDAEAGASITVDSDAPDAAPTEAGAGELARRSVELQLPEGAQTLAVRVSDEAGNVTSRELDVLVDTTGPAVTVRAPRVVRTASLALPITARDPHWVDLQVRLDGNVLDDALTAGRITQPTAGATSERDALPVAGTWTLDLEDGAYEGRHVLELVATDSLGTKTTTRRVLLVDSTESLGEVAGMRGGARGADVAELQAALIEEGSVTRAALGQELRSRTFGPNTRTAVQAFQRSRGMGVDGIAGADTIAGLTLRIVIDRGANTLTLFRRGDVVKTYPVATGSAEFPTPAGEFRLHDFQRNPTGTPPDSEWAKDAEPIGPGPDNPLGTRWMRVDGTVGIHGTNNPASLGYSVSHGCIRMSIPDVEELFEIVAEGTPVEIV